MSDTKSDSQPSCAFIFPGLNSEPYKGVGMSLAEHPAGKAVYDEAYEIVDFELARDFGLEGRVVIAGDRRDVQAAILTASVAALAVLRAELGEAAPKPAVCLGHSVGEYAALVAAGALTFADALKVVCTRAQQMEMEQLEMEQPIIRSAMYDFRYMRFTDALNLCKEAAQGQVCAVSMYNSETSIYASGEVEALKRLDSMLGREQDSGILADIPPLHCALMAPAAKALESVLADIEIHPLQIPVVHNVVDEVNTDATRVRERLVAQVTEPVYWAPAVDLVCRELGVTEFYSLGHGRRTAYDVGHTVGYKPHIVATLDDVRALAPS